MNSSENLTVAPQRRPRLTHLVALLLVSQTASATAQTTQWKAGTADNGQIVVKYNISERVNEDGVEVPLIEYVTTATASVSMQDCIALLKDPARHKDFMGDKTSQTLSHPSENEWVIYSYYRAPFSFPDNDRVTKMTFTEDPTRKAAVFSFEAAPTLLEPRGVKRVTYYSSVYTLEEREGGTVALTLVLKMSPPPSKAPLWMIKAAFPGAGADKLRNLVKLANGKIGLS